MKREILILTFLLIPAILAEDIKVYSINAELFKNDTVKINHIKVIAGKVSDYPYLSTGYKIKIHSSSKVLWEANLPVKFYIDLEDFGKINLEKSIISSNLPYFFDAKTIAIYHKDKQIMIAELKDYICNKNNVCDFGENEINCGSDCGSTKLFYIFFIFAILFFTILIYILLKKFLTLKSS